MNRSKEERNVLDFEDPGVLPNELMAVPGFVNELKDYTLATSPRPNEPLAFAGALAMLAHLSGRSYRDIRGTRTNLYLAALAPSGMGKERPRDVNKLLAAAAGCAVGVPDSVASGEGLEEAVAAHPSLLLQCDKADTLLTALRGNDGRNSRLNEMLLRFFSESSSSHVVRLKAADAVRFTEDALMAADPLLRRLTDLGESVRGALNGPMKGVNLSDLPSAPAPAWKSCCRSMRMP